MRHPSTLRRLVPAALATLLALSVAAPAAAADPAADRLACLGGDEVACARLADRVDPGATDGLASAEPGLQRSQACQAPPAFLDFLGEEAPRPRGLSAEQISGAMDRALPGTVACLGGRSLQTAWRVALTVDCSGRVTEAHVVDPGALTEPVVACVEEALAQASFPAHDDPRGVAFEYPARFVATSGR